MFKCLYLSMLPINGLKDKIKGFNSVADTQFKHIACSKIVGLYILMFEQMHAGCNIKTRVIMQGV